MTGADQVGPGPIEMWRTLRLALAHRREPLAYGRAVSDLVIRYLRSRRVDPAGMGWLDVGTGVGTLPEALAAARARVVALDVEDRRLPQTQALPFLLGSGMALPFDDGSFQGISCSNVLEHVNDPARLIDELLRVCRSDGFVYLSWTNWYSPFGGHDWSPLHYLGPRVGLRLYRAITGRLPRHVPGRTLFPVHVGQVVRLLSARRVSLIDLTARYWPSLRLLARVPGVREVVLWNCVILMRKEGPDSPDRAATASSEARTIVGAAMPPTTRGA